MGKIQDLLIIGVSMYGGHQSLYDPEGIVKHLDHRRETVGGARGCGDDVMFIGVIVLVVDALDDGQVQILPRR